MPPTCIGCPPSVADPCTPTTDSQTDSRWLYTQLYYMDHLAAFARVPFAAQGYGGFFTLSIMDKHYKENMTLEEAKSLMKRCFDEVSQHFICHSILPTMPWCLGRAGLIWIATQTDIDLAFIDT